MFVSGRFWFRAVSSNPDGRDAELRGWFNVMVEAAGYVGPAFGPDDFSSSFEVSWAWLVGLDLLCREDYLEWN